MKSAAETSPIEQPNAPLNVTVRHDQAADVWFVDQSDLPGLHAEAATLDELVAIIEDLAPELDSNLPTDASGRHSPSPICIRHVVTPRPARAA